MSGEHARRRRIARLKSDAPCMAESNPRRTQALQHPLDLEPALQVVDVPSAEGEEDDGLRDGPPLDAGVLRDQLRYKLMLERQYAPSRLSAGRVRTVDSAAEGVSEPDT
jgi:hypothetical protein